MVTGFPYYPRWEKRPEDRGRLFASEMYKGVSVRRGYLYVPKKASTIKRLLHELSFSFFAFINLLRSKRADVVVLFTPPFFLGLAGLLVAKLWRRPLVINVQDLPLDAALSLGMIKRGLATRILEGMESWIFRSCDQLTTISPGMVEVLLSKGIAKEKVSLVPNWIDIAANRQLEQRGAFLEKHPHLKEKMTFAYAGNIGVKQGVDLLVEAARNFQGDERVAFLIIGDGADKPRLLKIAEEAKLDNVYFLPFLGREEYLEMLTDVDVIFVAQRSGAGNNFFPSKLLGLMSALKPLLIAADRDSELARTVSRIGCGLLCDYEDREALTQNIRAFLEDVDLRAKLGERGRSGVEEFDRAHVLGQWRDELLQLANSSNRSVSVSS